MNSSGSTWPSWACPLDAHPLTDQGARLICQEGHEYAVVNGIPRFVAGSNYADHFGAQWNKYRTTQLDSFTGVPITRDRIRRCLGEDHWNSLAGKHVLECGCGAGRFTEILLSRGARVTSIDLSAAVDANILNCPLSDSHRIAQADIMHLPFAPESFDVVFCLGVVQHTPNPEKTIASLYSRVAPGGTLVIDHYAGRFAWYTKTAPLFRAYLKRLPAGEAMAVTSKLVDLFLPIQKAVRSFRPARSIVHRISPVLSYYAIYPELNDTQQREWSLLDTHDALTDWYKHFRTTHQIRRTLSGLGMEHIWSEYGGNGVEARGVRPLAPVKVMADPAIAAHRSS